MTLTRRQKRFVEEYKGNATEAYKRSSSKPIADTTAATEGCALLRNPDVVAAIEAKQRMLSEYVEADSRKVVTEYVYLSHNDLSDIFIENDKGVFLKPLRDWPIEIRRSISGFKVKRTVQLKDLVCPCCLEPIEDVEQPVEIYDIRVHSKPKALHDLAQHTGVLEQGAGTTSVNVQVNVEDVMRAREEAMRFRQQVIDQKPEEKNGES